MNKILSKNFLTLCLGLLLVPYQGMAAKVFSLTGQSFEASDNYVELLPVAQEKFNIPSFYNIPFESFSKLNGVNLTTNSSELGPNTPILINYTDGQPVISDDGSSLDRRGALGLRMFVLNDADNSLEGRKTNSNVLASTGILQDGDIVLSFRPEWHKSITYAHIQLGVSHAGMIYITEKNGKKYARNVDMPIDHETVAQGYLNAHHYQEAKYLHVLRPKGLSPAQKANISGWLKLFAKNGPAANKKYVYFNKDYSAPLPDGLTFEESVKNFAKVAQGNVTSGQKSVGLYCSAMVYSVLALRDCDPSQAVSSCKVSRFFPAMPIMGSVAASSDLTQPGQTVGMTDGIPLIIRATKKSIASTNAEYYKNVTNQILVDTFMTTSGSPTNISSGHRAVEAAILQQMPTAYEKLHSYFAQAAMATPNMEANIRALQGQINGMAAASGMPDNYSPTAFQVQAILPPEAEAKKVDYVGTVMYSSTRPVHHDDSEQVFLNGKSAYEFFSDMVK